MSAGKSPTQRISEQNRHFRNVKFNVTIRCLAHTCKFNISSGIKLVRFDHIAGFFLSLKWQSFDVDGHTDGVQKKLSRSPCVICTISRGKISRAATVRVLPSQGELPS